MDVDMFYKLDDNNEPVPCGLDEWTASFGGLKHILWRDHYERDETEMVSTIFLGLAHAGGMFETMHFPGNELRRCETYERAEKQHQEMVAEWIKDVK